MMGSEAAVRSLVVGTAGHIDHGKTTLVFAMTGKDTDRLPEEKSRGITIDLGFANTRMSSIQGDPVEVSFIDVPGHHAFIRNMVAGVAGVDCVLLVVAADEGVKPQTLEHLAICSLLGIRSGLVALTKADAVDKRRLQQTRLAVHEALEGTFLETASIIAVSARTGAGLAELRETLIELALRVATRGVDASMRLPLDRVFSVRGFGTVATGTLQAGAVRPGDLLEVQPGARAVRVRGVQVHGRQAEEAVAPTRAALNLAGVEVAELHRGQTLVHSASARAVDSIDVQLLELQVFGKLRHRAQVRFHAWTSETIATVLLYDGNDGAESFARLKLREPMVLFPGDRFVLRQLSPASTVAGGQVLDCSPMPRQRKAVTLAWLTRLEQASVVQQVCMRVERRGMQGISFAALRVESGLDQEALRKSCDVAVHQCGLVQRGEHLIAGETLARAVLGLGKDVDRAGSAGLSRAQVASRAELPAWLSALMVERLLTDPRYKLDADRLRIAESVAPARDELSLRIEELYRRAGLASPIVSEVASTLHVGAAVVSAKITLLLRKGSLVRLGSDHLLIHAGALIELRERLTKHRGERFDVAWFKTFTALTRKHAIPLLEYLDGARVTRNHGGVREVL